jgi:hypothetical protein
VSYGLGLLTGSDVKSCGVSFRRSRFSRQPIQGKPLWPTSSSGFMGVIPAATHTSSWTMYHSQPPTRGRPASVRGVVSMLQSLQSGLKAELSMITNVWRTKKWTTLIISLRQQQVVREEINAVYQISFIPSRSRRIALEHKPTCSSDAAGAGDNRPNTALR